MPIKRLYHPKEDVKKKLFIDGNQSSKKLNPKNISIQIKNALVVPFVQQLTTTTICANTKSGRNDVTYAIIILETLNDTSKKNEATAEITITNKRFPIIKAPAVKSLDINIISLEAGLVRVNFIVPSANSPLNISMQINAVNSGISV